MVAAEGTSQVKREGKRGSLGDWFPVPLLNCHLKNSSSCGIRITAAPGDLDLDFEHSPSSRATQSQAVPTWALTPPLANGGGGTWALWSPRPQIL